MTSSSMLPSGMVVDASLVIRAILPADFELDVLPLFVEWHNAGENLYAPDILYPEVLSVLWYSVFNRLITAVEAQYAVEDAFRLEIEIVPIELLPAIDVPIES